MQTNENRLDEIHLKCIKNSFNKFIRFKKRCVSKTLEYF